MHCLYYKKHLLWYRKLHQEGFFPWPGGGKRGDCVNDWNGQNSKILDGTSESEANCKIEHRVLGSVIRRTPFSLSLEPSPIDVFAANDVGRWMAFVRWCNCFGMREAGNISTWPGSLMIFSLNLTKQQSRNTSGDNLRCHCI